MGRIRLLLVGTAKSNSDRIVNILGLKPPGNLPGLVIGEIAILCVGHNKYRLHHIHTLDSIDPRLGNPLGKIADRHWASTGVDPQLVQGLQLAILLWIAQANFQLIVGIVRAVLTDHHPVGNHLYHLPDTAHIDSEHSRLGAIYRHLPLDTGQRQCILNIPQPFDISFDPLADLRGLAVHLLSIDRRDLDLEILAHRRPTIDFLASHIDTGHIPGALANFSEDLLAAPLPLFAGIELNQK